MTIVDFKNLQNFEFQMYSLLLEKFDKYADTWKTTDLNILRHKLRTQLDKLVLVHPTPKPFSERNKRKLIHIANYCYFLYTRLGADT